MSKFKRFEDILSWQKARILVKEVYKITFEGNFKKDFGLKDQIRRASVSIMLNIAEGFARKSNKEFSRFLFIAHGSVAEVQSILYIALDLEYINKTTFNQLYNSCNEISKMISGLIKYLSSS